jgi:hypothetical protein
VLAVTGTPSPVKANIFSNSKLAFPLRNEKTLVWGSAPNAPDAGLFVGYFAESTTTKIAK